MLDLDYHALLPEIILAVTVLVTLVVDHHDEEEVPRCGDRNSRPVRGDHPGLHAGVLREPRVLHIDRAQTGCLFGGSYVVDSYALVLKGVFIFAAFIVAAALVGYLESDRYYEGEYYFLLVASALGAVAMASSRDFVTMVVALELVSGPAFLLAGWRKGDPKSNEAALKFFITGVLALALLLMGVSLVYGLTGTQQFDELAAVLCLGGDVPLFTLGVIFILLGLRLQGLRRAVPFLDA